MQRFLLIALLSAGTLLAADEARVRELIAALAADDPAARDAASAELRTLGDQDQDGVVERLLEESSRSKDPEVAMRSREALAWIQAWERLLIVGGDGGDWSEGSGVLDVTTGEFAWRRPHRSIIRMGPRGRDACAYVNSAEKGLECVSLRTGEARWTTKALERGAILDGKYWLGHQEDGLVRISLEDGKVEWQRALVDGAYMGGPSGPPHDAHALYVWDDDGLLAVDASTGKDLWRTKAELLGLGSDGVYVTVPGIDANDAIVKLDPSSGRMLWLRDMPGDGQSIQGFDDGGAAAGLVLVGSEICHLFAIEAASGKVRWEIEVPSVRQWIEPDGAHAWIATFHSLLVMDLAAGKVIAAPGVADETSKLLVDGDTLYEAHCDQMKGTAQLQAFDIARRELRWTADVDGLPTPGISLASVRLERLPCGLVLVTESGPQRAIELVDPSTGKVIARHAPE